MKPSYPGPREELALLIEDWANFARPGDSFPWNVFPKATAQELLRRESDDPFWRGVLHFELVEQPDANWAYLSSSGTHFYGRVKVRSLVGDIEGAETLPGNRVVKTALAREVPTLTGRAQYRKIPDDIPFPKCIHRLSSVSIQRDREDHRELGELFILGQPDTTGRRQHLTRRIQRIRAEVGAGPDLLWFEGEIGTYRYGVHRIVERSNRERFHEDTFRECRVILHPDVPLYWCNIRDLVRAVRVRLGYAP